MLERIGRYRLLEQVGAGGQGSVYRAEDTELRRTVAVKVMNQTASAEPQYIEAIRREVQVAASLTNPWSTGNLMRKYWVLSFTCPPPRRI